MGREENDRGRSGPTSRIAGREGGTDRDPRSGGSLSGTSLFDVHRGDRLTRLLYDAGCSLLRRSENDLFPVLSSGGEGNGVGSSCRVAMNDVGRELEAVVGQSRGDHSRNLRRGGFVDRAQGSDGIGVKELSVKTAFYEDTRSSSRRRRRSIWISRFPDMSTDNDPFSEHAPSVVASK